MVILPPNTTLKNQPMNQEVKWSLIGYYHSLFIKRLLKFIDVVKETAKVSTLDAMLIFVKSYNAVSLGKEVNFSREAGVFKETTETKC